MGVRHKMAHVGQQDIEQSYAERALDTMALLCAAFDTEAADEIRALYRTLRYGSAAGSAAAATSQPVTRPGTVAGVLNSSVGGGLPSWREVIQPHPDVAEGRYQTAEFAADLAQVARGEGAFEYRDPVEFFARTYITEGMSGLLVKSLQRIAGVGGEPVIQLKTAFGGGKTHSMLALYHMVKSGVSVDKIPSLKPILDKAGLTELPKANVAVLVGTSLDPNKKKNPANLHGYTVNTIWGEMAYQLVTSAGRPDLYALIREADRHGVSPGSETLKTLLNECGHCLILMDELVAYGYIRFNPSDGVMMEIKKSHQWEKTHRHALTIEEQSAFLNYIASNEQYKHWLPMFTLFLGTGCRVGEIVGLRWEDCDFKQRIININHTLIYRLQDDGRVEYHITTPKTEAGIREIPMMDEVYDALVQLKNWQVLVGDAHDEIDGYRH